MPADSRPRTHAPERGVYAAETSATPRSSEVPKPFASRTLLRPEGRAPARAAARGVYAASASATPGSPEVPKPSASRALKRPEGRAPRPLTAAALRQRLARVKLLLCDVDGVLTDGRVFMGNGSEFKAFSIQDGLGLRLLQKAGVKLGWISARPSVVTTQRAADLKVDFLIQDKGSKAAAAEGLRAQLGLGWEEICFVGDDLVDLGLLRRVGVPVVVANGIAEAKALAAWVTRASGGHGAVREVATAILKAQGRWDALVAEFSA